MKNLSFALVVLLAGFISPAWAQKPIYIGKLKDVAAQYQKQAAALTKASGPDVKVIHPLPGGKTLAIKIKATKRAGSAERFFGEVVDAPDSRTYLQIDGTTASGTIIMFGQKKYYRYSSRPDGSVYLTEEDIDKVLCVGFSKDKSGKQKTAPPSPAKLNTAAAVVPPRLESLPGAEAVVYLDFDGETVTNTRWNLELNYGNPIVAEPVNLTASQMETAWKMMSEDFRPFALNVTTDEAVFNQAPIGRRMRVIYTSTDNWHPGVGGVAYLNSFSWGTSQLGVEHPCWSFVDRAKSAGVVGSHEVGHTLSLRHDGRTSPSEEYYLGQGSWAPIMGTAYTREISQWSKGEYAAANNQEDDLAKITTLNGFGYRGDDHGNDLKTATPLVFDRAGKVPAAANQGVIATRADVDVFSFSHKGGAIALGVDPDPDYPNLDIRLTLRNAGGKIIATADPATLSAAVDVSVAPGKYYLTVDGTGGALGADSDYGSLGAYSISTYEPKYCAATYAFGCTPFAVVINNFRFYTLENMESGCGSDNNGYSQYAPTGSLTTRVIRGESYPLSLQSGTVYPENFGVWIDFNNDKDFDDAGECVYITPFLSYDTFATTITIPATAASGATRLRVRSAYDPITSAMACTYLEFGETEDYTITIADPAGPTVSLTAPTSGATFQAPATINLTAEAADEAGSVVKVEFFQGTVKLGEDLTAPYAYSWGDVSAGTYALTAQATNELGATTTSAAVVVTVNDNVVAQGCGLGYWSNHPDQWGCFAPARGADAFLYGQVFGNGSVEPATSKDSDKDGLTGYLENLTLLQALQLGGGKETNLVRQSVAALLNTCSAEIAYNAAYPTVSSLQLAVNAAFTSSTKNAASNLATTLATYNDGWCPLESPTIASATLSSSSYRVGGQARPAPGLRVFPNPVTEQATVEFSLAQPLAYSLELYDGTGRLIRHLAGGTSEEGKPCRYQLDSRQLPAGIYLIRLVTGKTTQSFRLTKGR